MSSAANASLAVNGTVIDLRAPDVPVDNVVAYLRGLDTRQSSILTGEQIVAMTENVAFTGESLREAFHCARYDAWDVVLRNYQTSAPRRTVVEAMLESDRYGWTRRVACQFPGLPTDLVLKAIKDKTGNMRSDFAEFTDCEEAIRVLAKDSSPYTRRALTRNRHLPLDVEQRLARDRNADVRAAVAVRTSNDELMEKLANDREASVVAELASNPALPQRLQEQLAGYNHDGISMNLLARPDIAEKTAKIIIDNAYDDDYDLQVAIIDCPKVPLPEKARIAAMTRSVRVRRDLVQNLTMEQVQELMDGDDDQVKALLSKGIIRVALF